MERNVFLGKLYIVIDDGFIEVKGYNRNTELILGIGYIKDNYVYIYRGRNNDHSLPGIYDTKEGHLFVDPIIEEDCKVYSVKSIVEFDLLHIMNKIAKNRDSILSESDIEAMAANSRVYSTHIKDSDDALKRAIKTAINRKEINLNLYKDKFGNNHSLSNMRSALSKKSKMSSKYFFDWCEVLGLDYTVILSDNGEDTLSKLDEDVVVSSKINT